MPRDTADLLNHVRARRDLPPPAARHAIRVAAGVTQAACAEPLGVTQQAFATWESGKCLPRGDHLTAYVRLLADLRQAMAA